MYLKLFLSIFILLSVSNVQSQQSITFSANSPAFDTTGFWLTFKHNFTPKFHIITNSSSKADNIKKITATLVFLYENDPSIKTGVTFTISENTASIDTISDKSSLRATYGALMGNTIGIRFEDKRTGDYDSVLFSETTDGRWKVIKEGSNLQYYLESISYLVHGKLNASRNYRNDALIRLQEDCQFYFAPFYTQYECVVETLKRINWKNNPPFIQALKSIDKRTYEKF